MRKKGKEEKEEYRRKKMEEKKNKKYRSKKGNQQKEKRGKTEKIEKRILLINHIESTASIIPGTTQAHHQIRSLHASGRIFTSLAANLDCPTLLALYVWI
jgi:capsule polysaccharide export protein KpsC/LpsZ